MQRRSAARGRLAAAAVRTCYQLLDPTTPATVQHMGLQVRWHERAERRLYIYSAY